MRIVLSSFMLIVLAAPAFAGWEKLYEGRAHNRYVDPETITKDADGDGYRTAHLLSEYRLSDEEFQKVHPDGTRSHVSLREYDCKRNRSRELAWFNYSGRMGDGKLVSAGAEVTAWSKSTGNLASESVARFVCER
jgi:hypothetical protein